VGLFGDTKIKLYIKVMKMKIRYYKPIINWCDYQTRVYKNNSTIKWEGKVHETLIGYNTITELPALESFSLYHPKDIKRQEKQNQLYNTI